MRTLYLDCSMGAAGDMLNAALFELLDPEQKTYYLEKMNSLGIDGLTVSACKDKKCGIAGTHIHVAIDGAEEHECHHQKECMPKHARNDAEHVQNEQDAEIHHHASDFHHGSNMASIAETISSITCSESVKSKGIEIYSRIADAESVAHDAPIEHIHFHEVGTIDAIADVVGFCLLMDMLSPEYVVCSPINVGSGTVRCAHGVLPVPAPATATILKGIPTYSDGIKGELCTPTGAAILSVFSNEFATQPLMIVEKIGYGCGTKDFERANVVRAMLGESNNSNNGETNRSPNENVAELSCNVDDMSAEDLAYATDRLLEKGALDVFTTPVVMKKGRLATKVTCIAKPTEKARFATLMMKYTTTIGVRCHDCERFALNRETIERETEFGTVRFKKSEGFGLSKEKPEYDDIADIARANGISAQEVKMRIARDA